AKFGACPFTERQRIVVADVYHWKIRVGGQITLGKRRIPGTCTTRIVQEVEVLAIGDLGPGNAKRVDSDLMLRLLIPLAVVSTHHEDAALNQNRIGNH